MPRLVRKVTLYVCTVDGSVHTTNKDARARATSLQEKMKTAERKRAGKRGRPKASQTDAILKAIADGNTSAADIRRVAKVKPQNVHPLLHGLRKRKLVSGKSGSYSLTAAGKKKVAAE